MENSSLGPGYANRTFDVGYANHTVEARRPNYEPLTWAESRERLSQAGLSPDAWLRFLGTLLAEKMPMHSLMLSHQGVLLAEAHAAELDPSEPHRLFSVSKSVTALSIGCLAEENKLHLSDHLLDYYPEYQAEAHQWLRELTIEQMLKMETCHSQTTYKRNPAEPWVESFFIQEPDHAPGKVFCYDSSSSHVLAHLCERISGQSLLDYLRGRGLRERGFSNEAYFLTDPQGSPLGGSGLMASVFDFRLLAELVARGGGGVFPEAFCRQATANLTQTLPMATFPEESYGYGYMFWQHRNGWACYGMGGQMAMYVPNRELLLITTADLQKSKALMQRLYDLFFALIIEDSKPVCHLDHSTGPDHSVHLEPPTLRLPMQESKPIEHKALTIQAENPAIQVYFSYNEMAKGLLQIKQAGEILDLPFTIGEQVECHLLPMGHRAFVSAAWLRENQIYIVGQIIDEEVGHIEATLTFSSADLTLCLKNNVETGYVKWRGLWTLPREREL